MMDASVQSNSEPMKCKRNAYIDELRQKYAIDEQFDKEVQRCFNEAIGASYFLNRFKEYLNKKGKSLKDVGHRLSMNRGRISRLVRGEEDPGWDVIFRYLVVSEIDFLEVFPDSKEVLVQGIVQTLQFILNRTAETKKCLELNGLQWKYLACVYLRVQWKDSMQWKDSRSDVRLDLLLESVNKSFSASEIKEINPKELRPMINRCFAAWSLFIDATTLNDLEGKP